MDSQEIISESQGAGLFCTTQKLRHFFEQVAKEGLQKLPTPSRLAP